MAPRPARKHALRLLAKAGKALRRHRHSPRAHRLFLTAALLLLTATLARLRQPAAQPETLRPLPLPETNISTSAFAANIIVSELNRLIFCPVPKAANSNWKYLLRKWEGLPDYADLPAAHDPSRSRLRYLADYSEPEARALLADPAYFRFLFVRDPYTRLLSCYMDKFRNTDPAYVRREYRAFLAHLFSWRHARDADILNDPRPSFRAFVDELIKHDAAEMNAHWRPQTALCGVGVVPYDFVGKMETLHRDVRHVFERVGRPHEHFPTQEEIGFPPSGASAEVADGLYTVALMFKVRVVYDDDFRLLGYS